MSLKTRDPNAWIRVLRACGVAPATAAKWAPAFSMYLQGGALSAGDDELDDFLGQVLHECMLLERVEESLNYRADRLVAVFGAHRITQAQANQYGRIDGKQIANQREIGNIVYGGAWGAQKLGNTEPGDGWRFRGRGPIQITGRANYKALGDALGLDLIGFPDRLLEPEGGLRATIRWWEKNLPDAIMGNLPAVTKRVNGGDKGIEERRTITEAARRALASA